MTLKYTFFGIPGNLEELLDLSKRRNFPNLTAGVELVSSEPERNIHALVVYNSCLDKKVIADTYHTSGIISSFSNATLDDMEEIVNEIRNRGFTVDYTPPIVNKKVISTPISNLEEKIEKIKPVEPKTEVPDIWKDDFDKIENKVYGDRK